MLEKFFGTYAILFGMAFTALALRLAEVGRAGGRIAGRDGSQIMRRLAGTWRSRSPVELTFHISLGKTPSKLKYPRA